MTKRREILREAQSLAALVTLPWAHVGGIRSLIVPTQFQKMEKQIQD